MAVTINGTNGINLGAVQLNNTTGINLGVVSLTPTGVDLVSPEALPFLVGQVCFFSMNTTPTGFLRCNGAAVSRTTYSALFAAIGTTYGAGNGSTTFTLPDLRGEFLRCLDDGRGVDTSRAIGSAQTATRAQGRVHSSAGFGGRWGTDFDFTGDGDGGVVSTSISAWGDLWEGQGLPGGLTYTVSTVRTRPRNIAMVACVKF